MSRQIDLQTVLSDDELEYLESRGRDADLAVNAVFLINESDDKSDADPETPSDADPQGEADKSEGDGGETAGDPPDPATGDDQSESEAAKVETSTATRTSTKKS